MRRLTQFYFISIFIITLSASLLPVLATDDISNEFVLILYYEGENIKPNDSIVIKAELYKTGKRLDKPNDIQISLYINMPIPYNQHIHMIYEHEGIYISNMEVPQDYQFSYLRVEATAFINEESVTDTHINIPIEVNNRSLTDYPIYHFCSHQIAKPNDKIYITSYVPEVENNTIESVEVIITINVIIKYIYKSTYEVESKFKSEYQGSGLFLANYTIPASIDNNSLRITDNLLALFDINTTIQGQEFSDRIQIDIDDFQIISSLKLENNEIQVKIIALDDDSSPIKDVNWTINIDFVYPFSTIVNLPSFIPNTNEEGITEIILESNQTIYLLSLSIIGMKDNKISFQFQSALGLSYILKIMPDNSIDTLNLLPTFNNFEYKLHYYNEGIRGSYYAFSNEKLLENTKLYIYLSWSKGIISTSSIKTDSTGWFCIKENWPKEYGDSPLYQNYIQSLYYNGTFWIRDYFYYSHPELDPFPHDFVVNEVNKPSISINEFEQYKRINITWEVPSNRSVLSLALYPQYEFFPIYYSNIMPPEFFYDYTPFLNLHSQGTWNTKKINYECFIDTNEKLDHFIVEGITYSKDNPTDLKCHFWFINVDGTLRDKPKDFSDPSSVNLDTLLRVSLFIMILGAILVIFFIGKKINSNI